MTFILVSDCNVFQSCLCSCCIARAVTFANCGVQHFVVGILLTLVLGLIGNVIELARVQGHARRSATKTTS